LGTFYAEEDEIELLSNELYSSSEDLLARIEVQRADIKSQSAFMSTATFCVAETAQQLYDVARANRKSVLSDPDLSNILQSTDPDDPVNDSWWQLFRRAFLTYFAGFGEDKNANSLIFNASFRHFVPVYKDYITFAYRLATQLNVAGDAPFYINNYYNNLFIQRVLYEGLGGSNTNRGILRNRITSKGYALANVEFRFNIYKFDVGKEHFAIGLNPFVDMGLILQPYNLDKNVIVNNIQQNDPEFDLDNLSDFIVFDESKNVYRPHFSGGLGLKIMMNDNFVLSVDWAAPFDKRDNDGYANFYINVGYMF
jgi:hypothetical protein